VTSTRGQQASGDPSNASIETEIKKLGLKDRAALARWLVGSLDELSDAEVEALWVEEAERRLDDLEQKAAVEVPAQDALSRARAAIS
jgi:hypothetical protein